MDAEKPSPLQRLLHLPVEIVVAVFLVLDEIVAPLFRPVMRCLSGLRLIQRLEAAIGRLPPYLILGLLVLPFGVAELAKVYAVVLMAGEHFRTGITIFIAAYIVSILVCERIFQAGKGQLMTIGWFKIAYDFVMRIRDRVFGWIKATAAWQMVQDLKLRAGETVRRLKTALGPRPQRNPRPAIGFRTIMRSVDLNCDCGEGFGAYSMGDDRAMLDIVTSANVACGFHAGDPDIMAATFALAKSKGVAVGAHPGFADRAGFGRRPMALSEAEIERLVAYQVGAAQALAAQAGHQLTHVKPHGALSNIAMKEAGIARAIARATKAVDPRLVFLAIAGTPLEHAGEAEGLMAVREIYADRGYTDEGLLAPRGTPGAVLDDAEAAATRAAGMVADGAVLTLSGKKVPVGIDSICVHGDTPGAVAMARAVRAALEGAGIAIRPFAGG